MPSLAVVGKPPFPSSQDLMLGSMCFPAGPLKDNQVAIGLDTERHRPIEVVGIVDVNIVIRDNRELHLGDREQREQRVFALAWSLPDRGDQRPVATAAP